MTATNQFALSAIFQNYPICWCKIVLDISIYKNQPSWLKKYAQNENITQQVFV